MLVEVVELAVGLRPEHERLQLRVGAAIFPLSLFGLAHRVHRASTAASLTKILKTQHVLKIYYVK